MKQEHTSVIRGALCGDLHLWHTQYGRSTRGASLSRAALAVVKDIIDRRFDFVMLSGDSLNAVRPTPETILVLKQIDDMFRSAGIPVFCISGNHDYTGSTHWIETCTNQTLNERERRGLIMADWKSYRIVDGIMLLGIPGVDADEIRRRLPEMPDTEIVLAHFTPKEVMGFTNDRSLSIKDVIRKNTDVVALGDYHEAFINHVQREDGHIVTSVMPGSVAHCAVSESDDKGYVELEFNTTAGKLVRAERILISSYDVLRIDMSAEPDALSRLSDTLANRDGTRELLLVVKFDAATHSLKTALEIVGTSPNVTVLSRPYLSEREVHREDGTPVSSEDLLPLEFFLENRRVGVACLDRAAEAVLKRVPDADAVMAQAVSEFLKDDSWMSSSTSPTTAST